MCPGSLLITIYVLLVCSIGLCQDNRGKDLLPTQDRLLEEIFRKRKYDAKVAPIVFSTQTQLFNFAYTQFTGPQWYFRIYVRQLVVIDLDEPHEQVSVTLNLLQEWVDSRLAWNESEYDDIYGLFVRKDSVWNPSMQVSSASEVKNHEDSNIQLVRLYSSGTIWSELSMRLTVNCNLYLQDFPFDIQACELHLGLFSIDFKVYNMTIFMPDMEKDIYCGMGNSAWDVINVTTGTFKTKLFSVANTRFGVVRVTLKRNPLFYLYMIILPTFIINMIAISGVFLEKATPMERLTIGFTHIMTMTFILGLISEKIPKTKDVPLLGNYIILGLGLMIVAMTVSKSLKRCCMSKIEQKTCSCHSCSVKFVVIILQLSNIVSSSYMLYRYLKFEHDYGINGGCKTAFTEYSQMTNTYND